MLCPASLVKNWAGETWATGRAAVGEGLVEISNTTRVDKSLYKGLYKG